MVGFEGQRMESVLLSGRVSTCEKSVEGKLEAVQVIAESLAANGAVHPCLRLRPFPSRYSGQSHDNCCVYEFQRRRSISMVMLMIGG